MRHDKAAYLYHIFVISPSQNCNVSLNHLVKANPSCVFAKSDIHCYIKTFEHIPAQKRVSLTEHAQKQTKNLTTTDEPNLI